MPRSASSNCQWPFDGRLVSKPDEKVGKQVLEWLDRGLQATPAAAPDESARTPLFNESGNLTGEKETKAMLEAIQKAATLERLDSIEQSIMKRVNTKKLTEDQAKHLADEIEKKRSQIQSISRTKAA